MSSFAILCGGCKKFFGGGIETHFLCSWCYIDSDVDARELTPTLLSTKSRLGEMRKVERDVGVLFQKYCDLVGLPNKVMSNNHFKVITNLFRGKTPSEVEASIRGFRPDVPAMAFTARQGIELYNICYANCPAEVTGESKAQYVHSIFPFVIDKWRIDDSTITEFGSVTLCYYNQTSDTPTMSQLFNDWGVFRTLSLSIHSAWYNLHPCSICLDMIRSDENSMMCGTCRQSVHIGCVMACFGKTDKRCCPNCRTDWDHPGDLRDTPPSSDGINIFDKPKFHINRLTSNYVLDEDRNVMNRATVTFPIPPSSSH